ncbi:MAG: hypothetical protein C0392_11620 [Syntrophus sp. (in: bacteria)]|nr:hypothetical protein [Syntrophus sp. (in: bacteria)]
MDDVRLILTIMPDYGNAAYAWIRREGSSDDSYMGKAVGSNGSLYDKYVGGSMVDETGFYCDKLSISKELQEDFEDWAIRFELYADFRRFNWERFHERGLILAKRLKKEIGDRAILRYMKPSEDPNWKADEMTFIE